MAQSNDKAATTGKDLTGQEHRHDFSVPYRGHLMCSADYCGDLRTLDGRPLTDVQQDEIRRQLTAEYVTGASGSTGANVDDV